MCSTPQKQPAATVAFCAPSGMAAAPFSADEMPSEVAVVKGRVSRAMKPGMAEVIVAATARRASMRAMRVCGWRVVGPWRGSEFGGGV